MKSKLLFFLLLLIVPFISIAQSDTLNKTNTNGERYGWWIVYLNDNLEAVKDTADATHYHYTLYTGKFNHYNMGAIGTKKTPVIFPASDTLETNGLKLLNGEYKSNFKSGSLRFVLTVQNGIFVDYKEYYENGNLNTHFKYTVECGTPIHICILMYNEDGSLKYEGTNQVPED
jgi:glycogen debranching enzyme